jgi:hypothetical protein
MSSYFTESSFANLQRIAANGCVYEKLPFAGDFLSSYTKVEAGYNPRITN